VHLGASRIGFLDSAKIRERRARIVYEKCAVRRRNGATCRRHPGTRTTYTKHDTFTEVWRRYADAEEQDDDEWGMEVMFVLYSNPSHWRLLTTASVEIELTKIYRSVIAVTTQWQTMGPATVQLWASDVGGARQTYTAREQGALIHHCSWTCYLHLLIYL